MTNDNTSTASNRHGPVTRRRLLRAAATTGALFGGIDPARATRTADARDRAAPPGGTTSFGDTVELGGAEARPFTALGPSDEVHSLGLEFDRDALSTLPDADELSSDRTSDTPAYDDKYGRSGRALSVHRRDSLEFFIELPDAAATPFTFIGLNWNPAGHPGAGGAWAVPHFDVHFHMLETERIDAIEGPAPAPYDCIPAERIPAGYRRSPPETAAERYITDMGEHTAPSDAPEVPGEPDAFTNTLIHGFVSVGGDPRLAFLEPMVTRRFLDAFEGTERYEISQPETYPHDGRHPTAYSVRSDSSEDTVAVALTAFESI